MKKLILCITLLTVVSFAEEISLGLVVGAEGDSLILVDGVKVYVPNLAYARYITKENSEANLTSVTYPYTASLITATAADEEDPFSLPTAEESPRNVSVIKIHAFYDIVDGRLVKR